MRVTQGMMISTTLSNIANNQARLQELQDQITSGRKVRKPSDDPVAASRALAASASIEQTAQYRRNLQSSSTWLKATDTALQQVTDVLQRARELAVSGANQNFSSQQRQAMGAEVAQLFNSMIDLGNSKSGGRYIFAGHQVQTQPFRQSSGPDGYSYQGDTGEVQVEIGPNNPLTLNMPGTRGFPQALQALHSLTNALNSSDLAGIQNSMSALDTALDGNLGELASVGAKSNRVDATDQRAQDTAIDQTAELSSAVDIDITDSLLNFNTMQTVYQASLKAAGQAIQPSLLDYLK